MTKDCLGGDVLSPGYLPLFTAAMSAVFGVLSTIANFIIVYVIVKDPLKKLHTPFMFFYATLSVSDLMVGVLGMPASVYFHVKEFQRDIVPAAVWIMHLSQLISSTVSVFCLIALALDRYLAVVHTFWYKQNLNHRNCKIITALIWLVSLTVGSFYYIFGYIKTLMVFANAAACVSLIIICVVNYKVSTYMKKQTSKMETMLRVNSTDSTRRVHLQRIAREKKVTMMLFYMILTFVVTYFPATIMIYILEFCDHCSCFNRHIVRDVVFLLTSSNICCNPFILTSRLKNIRLSLKALVTKKK